MRRLLLRLIGLTAALVAAVLVWVVATLPPAAIRPAPSPPPVDLVTGAYHIHSSHSDGSGTADDIATAASRAGLRFVIITDHGDATRPPDPPAYRHGVLCIDAVEVSTTGGHVVALNLTAPAPYPLAGEPREVVADIRRLGGWAVAAHPDSPRPSLRWRAPGVVVDGIEWFNADSAWRAHGFGVLAATAARALFRPAESVATLFQEPAPTLARWDAATSTTWDAARSTTQMFSLAAVDAHARLGQDPEAGPAARSLALSFPGYETMFRTVTQTVKLEGPLTSDAGRDAAAVIAAITSGRSYSVVRAFIDAPYALSFSASTAGETVEFGGSLENALPATFRAAVPPGTGARLVLVRAGKDVASGLDRLEYQTSDPGAYRLEARLADRAVPWIVSNAIRIGERVVVVRRGEELPSATQGLPAGTAIAPQSWTIESDPSSTGAIGIAGSELRLQYRLGPGAPTGQFVALATSASGSGPVQSIEFTASSPRPLRLSVQVRLPGGVNGQRWQRSVYIDQTPRRISVPLSDLEPVDRRTTLRPVSARVQSILLVIDTLNSSPGSGGEVVFRDLASVAGR